MPNPTITHTANINPELLSDNSLRAEHSIWITVVLCLVMLVGFGFRVVNLGAESLSEDELNKLMAVADYRANGLTAANGEHPMLMKVSQTISVVGAEKWNSFGVVANHPNWHISTEAALRFPNALLGVLTVLLIFLICNNLFGTRVALLAGALWALDPNAIAFNRIAKEDTFVIFFFLLANVFWLRAQRIAETNAGRFVPYYWAAAAAFGAMVASKYLPHFIGISVGYYYVFQGISATRWRIGRPKFLIFLMVMGVAFVICNPAILLPATWQQMRAFASEHRIGHDSYEFIGTLYRNQSSLWFKGIPWYFYFAYIAVKSPVLVLFAFIVGIPRIFSKKLGDGRYFLLVWALFWFMPFSVLGGKFTRYFTLALPLVLIIAAIGINWAANALSRFVARSMQGSDWSKHVFTGLSIVVLLSSVVASASATPNFRLYTNVLGGGWSQAGSYFPHDEFYDAATRDITAAIGQRARPGALVLTETPGLYSYYSGLQGRKDIIFASLSDPNAVAKVQTGDFVVEARGRRYFSNERVTDILHRNGGTPIAINLGPVLAARVYQLEGGVAQEIAGGANK